MRHFFLTSLAVLWIATAVRAGYYDPVKPVLDVPKEALPFDYFRDRLADRIMIGDASRDTKPRQADLKARAALQQVADPSPNQLVQRGLLSMRLRDTELAFADFHLASRLDRQNFWALSALGTAYEHSGQNVEAVHHLEASRELMPRAWPIPAEEAAAHRAEAALLNLARQRMTERVRNGRLLPQLDDLFGVKFVGPTGDYEAGKLAPAEAAKLPKDAIATVQQLLFWMPDDSRLYWLLGELYNATGDIDSAYSVFDECVGRFDAPDLRRHRQILRDALDTRQREGETAWMPDKHQWLIAASLAIPVLAGLAYFQMRQIARRLRGRGN